MNYRRDFAGSSARTRRAFSLTAISMTDAIETRRCSARKRRSSIVARESRKEVWSFDMAGVRGGTLSICNIPLLYPIRGTMGAEVG